MPQITAHIPYSARFEEVAEQMVAQAPGSSGFDTGEVLIVVEGVRSASTIAPLLRLEVTRTEDETAFRSTCLWVTDRPGLGEEVAAVGDQLRSPMAAFRIIHLDVAEPSIQTVVALLEQTTTDVVSICAP